MKEARRKFELQSRPESTFADGVGRFSLSKTFHGDLEGTSTGEMLAVRTEAPGSGGYVMIERVSVKLDGRSGDFLLAHHGIMDRNRQDVRIVVIPDSGTGELVGIAGQMSIDAAANHAYVLSYSLP